MLNCEWLRHFIAIAHWAAAPLNWVLYVGMITHGFIQKV